MRSVRVVGNVGLGILGDPTGGDRQNDVVTYGVSFARALTQAAEVVGEVNGHLDTRSGAPPPGTGSRGVVRSGRRATRSGAGALMPRCSSASRRRDPGIGIAGGFTYVFNAFDPICTARRTAS